MALCWIILLVTLLASVSGDEQVTPPCAEVRSSAPFVLLGSSVNASCFIRADCPLTFGQEEVRVDWHLNERPVPSSGPLGEGGGWISRVVLLGLRDGRSHLTCCVYLDGVCQIVGGVEIRAGLPPPVPRNLSCVTNLSQPLVTLSCKWDPGPETDPPAKYTLHTLSQAGEFESTAFGVPAGVHHYQIPRASFSLFSKMQIFVQVENALGNAASDPLILDPLEAAKFDPPKILRIRADRHECLTIQWNPSRHQDWVKMQLDVEVRYRPIADNLWTQQPGSVVAPTKAVNVCNLLHGLDYYIQMRIRYCQSPWSEWSGLEMGCTLEKAPTGRLDTWMKVSKEKRHSNLNAQLFWKPSTQFRANGKNVTYIVSLNTSRAQGVRCVTSERHCEFSLPRDARVYLTAMNAAGRSSPTRVPVYRPKGLAAVSGINVSSHGERALLVRWWSSSSLTVTGYVIEWRPLCSADFSLVSFILLDSNHTSTVVSENVKPYKPYQVSVYPWYKDGFGPQVTSEAYSKQSAPSVAPHLKVEAIKTSTVQISWDQIPLEQRNGIIRSYRVSCWDEKGKAKVLEVAPSERRALLRDLRPGTEYTAFLTVSTDAGSVNGSMSIFQTEHVGAVGFMLTWMTSVLPLLAIILFIACFRNQKQLKTRFWPAIPDPANSTVKKWTMLDMPQDIPPLPDVQDPTLMYISHLSLLEAPEKGWEIESRWMCDSGDDPTGDDTSDLAPSAYDSSSSVPYATVVFHGPYITQPLTHAYQRSESTQPLIEPESARSAGAGTETSVETDAFGGRQDDGVRGRGTSALWEDFPLLSSMAVTNEESEC